MGQKCLFSLILCLFMAEGLPTISFAEATALPKKARLSSSEMKYLERIEKATFRGFEKLFDPVTRFPVDIASVSSGNVIRQPQNESFSKTSPTNIGFGFLYTVHARDKGYLGAEEAYRRALQMMEVLEKLETHEGFLYNWYYLSGESGKIPQVSQNRFVSSLDNGDLDILLMVAAGAFSGTELSKRIDVYLQKKDYRFFYDKNPTGASSGMINVGFDQAQKRYHAADYSIFNIEGRMMVLFAILKDGLPDSVWTDMSRLVKTYTTREGEKVSVVAPWGGSLYETLFADEILGGFQIAPEAFRTNALHMIKIHRDYGKRVSKSGIWGFSNGEVPGENKYEMTGVPEIAYNRFPGEFVTLYSAFLSLRYAPDAVIENLKAIESLNPNAFSAEYGFTDSIDPKTGAINHNILSLDKGMELLSIANFMNNLEGKKEIPDYLWGYFKQKGWDEKANALLEAEENHPSFQAITDKIESRPSSIMKKKVSPLDAMKVRREIGAFHEPDRASASFQMTESGEGKEKQIVEVHYDVTERYSFSGLFLKFDDLDISDYDALSLQIRGDEIKGFPETVKVEIKSKGKHIAFDHVRVSPEWHKADIKLPPGKKTVDEIALVFENAVSGDHPKGKVNVRSLFFQDGILK